MELFEAISGRRSIGRVKDEPVARELIERILEAGNWAPSHNATEPWRFFVMTGSGRDRLARAYADIAAAQAQEADEDAIEALRAKQAVKAYRAPLVIAVAVSPSSDPRIVREEEFAAAHAAVQNMLLAAHALGLGAIWRSGAPMYEPAMREAFGLRAEEALVGLIYAGVPDMPMPAGRRRPVADKTVWLAEG